MGLMVKGTELTRHDDAGKSRVSIALSELAAGALVGEGRDQAASTRLESALRCYLGDRETDRPAWPYPRFLRGSEPQRDVEIEFEVPTDLWEEFAEEAARQEVAVEQLAEHAAFYFAAELDAGRVTERIIADLEVGETRDTAGD
jgi:hypothetical protein